MARAILSSCALLLLFIASVANAQTTHRVGGSSNWNTGVNYDTWASGTTFTVGDTLSFTHNPSHDVSEVNQADYDSCSMSNLISSDSSSPVTIPLSAAGTRYFVCSRSNHCAQRMKVTITTVSASGGTTPSPPPSGTTPSTPGNPSSPGTPSTPATPSTPDGSSDSPPPPPPSGNAAGRSGLSVGLLTVAAVVGFMA